MNAQYIQTESGWAVRARPGRWPPDRAILLHELLHAFHQQVLGQPTLPVGRALQEALRVGTYPPEYKYDPSLPLAFRIADVFGMPIERIFDPNA